MANYYVNLGPTLGTVLRTTTASGIETIRVTAGPTLGPSYSLTLPSGANYIIDNGPTFGLAYSAT